MSHLLKPLVAKPLNVPARVRAARAGRHSVFTEKIDTMHVPEKWSERHARLTERGAIVREGPVFASGCRRAVRGVASVRG